MSYDLFALRFAISAVFLFFVDVSPHVAYAHHCPGEPDLPAKPNHSCRTRTQTIHEGEPKTTHPGGNPGRGSQALPEELQNAECIAPIDPQVMESLRNERNEALRTMAGMGYAADRTLTAMGKLIVARLQHLTEPNEGILVRTSRAAGAASVNAPAAVVAAGKAVAAYLSNDNAANHRYLYGQAQASIKSAEQALKQMVRNPHVTIATAADELLIGKATGMGGAACRWSSDKVADFAGKVGQARKAKQTVACVNANAQEFTAFQQGLQMPTGNQPKPRPGGPPPPPPATRLPQLPSGGIPPTCYKNQCWPNVQAVDHYWKTGQWIEPKPLGYPLVEELSDLPSLDPFHVKRDLKAKHGADKAVDPGHGSCGLQAHAEGVPVVSSKELIEQSIQPGQQGYVFIIWEQAVGNEVVKSQHVVNVRGLRDGTVEFFDRGTVADPQLRGAVEPQLWANAKKIGYFRSW